LTQARRDLAGTQLERYIKRVVDAAPPLTPAQRDRLALLLTGGGAWHLGELAAAIATREIEGGGDKLGKKLMRTALIDPTENVLAQAEWAKL
jgi:hypothetical protein